MAKLHFLGKLSIDSFKIRIPLTGITIIDKNFNVDVHVVNGNDGELLETFKRDSYLFPDKTGISTRYAIQHLNFDQKNKAEYLVILINSKVLEGKYFQGIQANTIDDVYNRLISHKVVYFTKDDFLKSEITDVDIKKDILISDFDKLLKTLESLTIPHKRSYKGCIPFNRKDNLGIQWSDRRKGTPTNPYFKVYHKGIELTNKSTIFNETYLNDFPLTELSKTFRFEFTLKNRKHFKRYGLNNVLGELINESQEKLNNILGAIVNIHMTKFIKIKKVPASEFTASEQRTYNAMNMYFKYISKDLETFIEMYLNGLNERTFRRSKNEIIEVYKKHISKNEYKNENFQNLYEFEGALKQLGLFD